MANTLTNLIPILHKAVDVVSRELTGMIPSVTVTPGADMAAVGQKIYYPIVGAGSPTDIAAAATGPDPSDHTVGNDYLEISKSQSDTFYYTGEEQLGLGGMYDVLVQNQFAQKMRALVNAIESDLTAAGLRLACLCCPRHHPGDAVQYCRRLHGAEQRSEDHQGQRRPGV